MFACELNFYKPAEISVNNIHEQEDEQEQQRVNFCFIFNLVFHA